MGQSNTDSLDAVLQHHGVEGMKWGVRRTDAQLAAAEERRKKKQRIQVSAPDGKRVKTKGGSGLPASSDAIKSAALKQKAKSSTIDSLSNAELKDLTQRLNLEMQYKDLMKKDDRRSAGKKFFDKFMDEEVASFKSGGIDSTQTSQLIDMVKKMKNS